MKSEELSKFCVAVTSVPKTLTKDGLAEYLKKHFPIQNILDLGVVLGIETDTNLTRWILLLTSNRAVDHVINTVKHDEVEVDGKSFRICFQKAIACELPEGWEEKYKDFKQDGNEAEMLQGLGQDPSQTAVMPGPGLRYGRPGHPLMFPGQQQVGPYGTVSGFYVNYPHGSGVTPDGAEGMQTHQEGQSSSEIRQSQVPLKQLPNQGLYPMHAMFPGFPNPGNLPSQGQSEGSHVPQGQMLGHFPHPPYGGHPMFPMGMPPSLAFGQQNMPGGQHAPLPPGFMPFPLLFDPQSKQYIPFPPAGFPLSTQLPGAQTGTQRPQAAPGPDEPPPPYNEYSTHTEMKHRKEWDSTGQRYQSCAELDQEKMMRKFGASETQSPVHGFEQEQADVEDTPKPEVGPTEKTTKILVSNLPSTVHDEYLEMFFENTRKCGGGPVFHVELDEEEHTAIIEFCEPEAVEIVLSKRPIQMMGQKVDVDVYIPEEPKPKCTIEVTGPPSVVCEEQLEPLEMYFENVRRSGGGPVVSATFDAERNMALITFETEEIAMRVEERGNHFSKKEQLSVKLHIPEKKQVKKQQTEKDQESNVKDTKPVCTVKVKGVDKTASRDTLEFYFENSRRSGGGEIETVKSDEEDDSVLYVTFKSAEAARHVAEREHSLEHQNLKVSLFVPPTPPPSYEDRILIKGLNPSTTQDCLFNFIEAKTGFIPERMDYHADQEGIVMVTFQINGDEDLDFERLDNVFEKTNLEGARLKTARVPISDCIIVSNLASEVTKDTIEYYFENVRKSGGGAVKKVVMTENETCLVYFQDYAVIENLLKRGHTLGNQLLDVKRYQECLSRPEGELAERKLQIPEAIFIQDIDPSVIKFMHKSKANQTAVQTQLELCNANVIWPQDEKANVMLECKITKSTPDCYKLVKTWRQEAMKNLQDYLKTIAVFTVPILQEIWQRVMTELQAIKVDNPDAVALFADKKEGALTVVGMKNTADVLTKDIEEITKKVFQEAEKEKSKVKEVVTNLKPIETKMLLADKFSTKMEKPYPELKVKINQGKNEILFEGMLIDVQAARLQMYEMKNSFASQVVNMVSPTRASLYNLKQTKEYIVKKLKAKGVTAVWEVSDGKLTVMSTSSEQLEDCINVVVNCVVENTIALRLAAKTLMSSELWQSKMDELHAANIGVSYIVVLEGSSKIHIVTTDDIANGILENIKKFLRLNTVTEETMPCPKHAHRLFERFYKEELAKISKDLVSHHVQITSIESYGGFQIKGTEDGVNQAKSRLTALLEKVQKREHVADKPGLGEFMQTPKGKDGLNTIETSLGCVVAVKNAEQENESSIQSISAFVGSDSHISDNQGKRTVLITSCCRAYDLRNIFCVQGDMTELTVDALINPADDKLSFTGGLGKALLEKGGTSIIQECSQYIRSEGQLGDGEVFVSTAGQLKADIIIHVIGPVWKGGRNKEDEMLAEAVFKCLLQASTRQLKSVAVPAISCGSFGYPLKKATLTIVAAVKNFFREVQDSTLVDVYLCDMKQNTVDGFAEALKQEFGLKNVRQLQIQRVSGTDDEEKIRPIDSDEEADLQYTRARPKLPDRGSASGSEVYIENIKVSVVKGEIAKQKVDMIVNTTARNLDLKNGAVSLSLLKCAGDELQQEVSQKYPSGIKDGEIAVTSGQRLNCKTVVHTSLGNWDQAKAKLCIKDLHTLMRNSLQEAEKQSLNSVAFPAIGTGNLGFPKDVVAKEMFNGVQKFVENSQPANVTDVRFIVYQKDFSTITAFEDELKRWSMGTRGEGGKGGRQKRKFNPYEDLQTGREEYLEGTKSSEGRASDSGSRGYTTGSVTVSVIQGDITAQNADCIVNSSNEDLDLKRGAVSQQIMKKGGTQLAQEIKKRASEMKKKHMVVTSAPGLQCKHILHIVAKETAADWKNMVEKCLKEAENQKLRSIAFPALGTQGTSMTPLESASIMTKAVISFAGTMPAFLHDIRFVIFQKSMVEEFHTALQQMLKKSNPDQASSIHFGSPSRKMQIDPNRVTFIIVAQATETIEKAVQKLDILIEREIHEKKFSDSIIRKMDDNQLMEVKAIAKQHHLEMHLSSKDGIIQITGIASNVMAASDKIHRIMRDAATIEQQKSSAALLSSLVQWYYIEITEVGQELVKYDSDLNFKIETAYRSQAPNVKFVADNVRYVLDFTTMEEFDEMNTDNRVTVIRRDLVKEGSCDTPTSWGVMTGNLKVVVLQQSDQEYQDIAQKFVASAGSGLTITKIERIQNKTLWTQYQAKKKQLDDQNPPNTQNETMLWHGTASDAVDNINFHGFNRSYCGKNATAYGDGVYFAVNANYSASDTYSRPDQNGLKRIYYTRVLTGLCTRGVQGMRVPPAKQGGNNTALYDSVVDNENRPNMYIIFHDTQAYPEYLVTFKK